MPTLDDMGEYLSVATLEQLQEAYAEFQHVPVAMAWGGKNKGLETIQHRFMQWRKGTPAETIERWFAENIEIVRKKEASWTCQEERGAFE